MTTITSYNGKTIDTDCIGCLKKEGREKERVYKGRHVEVSQDFEIPIPGFFVLGVPRHIKGFGDLTSEEGYEFIDVLSTLRRGLEDVLGVEYADVLCREETIMSKTNPSHFHLALLPKYTWMKGRPIQDIFKYAKETFSAEEGLKQVDTAVVKMREYMNKEMNKLP